MDKPYEKYFDDAVQKIQEGMSALAAKTDELTQKGKLKFEILSIKRDIDKNLNDLGKLVYDLLSEKEDTAISENSAVSSTMKKLKGLNEKLTTKKKEYDNISHSEAETKQESDADFV
ncbi:MAG: hypothetical protein DWQ05_16670 [Calditrichaeota bacterium]|nr:MAG: hypothetical protein DWQ05_16670 [Calditrichota bacterium]